MACLPGKSLTTSRQKSSCSSAKSRIFKTESKNWRNTTSNYAVRKLRLKRGCEEIMSEWIKPRRKLQLERMQKNDRIRRIANKCHWLGWGEEDRNKILFFDFA